MPDLKNNLYLCIHYAFGDYVICYGMIKELSKRYDNIFLFGIPHRSPLHIENIKRLYSNIENVQVITGDPKLHDNVTYIGWDKYAEALKTDPSIPFTRFFYEQAGVPLNLLWDNFYFERDIEKEKDVYYNRLKLKDNETYAFLHDDPTRKFVINRAYITKGIKIIHLDEIADVSVLDTLYLIEKAKEVHIFNTGLLSFIDQMNIRHSNLNYHKYVRPSACDQPILRLKWNVISKKWKTW